MSARHELAKLIHGRNRTSDPYPLAEAILAAGYVKPRTITAIEELDEFGTNAAILAANGAVWVNDGDCTEPWACVTEDPQGGPVWADGDGIHLPAIVLHEAAA